MKGMKRAIIKSVIVAIISGGLCYICCKDQYIDQVKIGAESIYDACIKGNGISVCTLDCIDNMPKVKMELL